MENSAEIWKLFVDGEDQSFRSLIFIHYTSLYNYGNKFTGDSEIIKDAIQDLFLIIWNKRGQISQPENIKAYLFSSLRRIIHRKIAAIQKKSTGEKELGQFDFQLSIEQEYIKEESTVIIAKRIESVVSKLPARQKEVIFLKFYQGFSRNEIGEAMGISPQTVSNLLQIALNKMKTDLGHTFNPSVLYFIVPVLS